MNNNTNVNFKSLLDKYDKIEIPIIQRDYAQGRKEGKAPKIREEFLSSILEFLESNSTQTFHLDFVYGIAKDNKFIPLDGQQRLTTLFLLYWYLGKKDQITDLSCLKKFTYETRISSREFCEFLVGLDYKSGNTPPSVYIKNQNKYISYWEKDPTIQSMLVMLDAIHGKFYQKNNLYDRLNLIQFSFPTEEIELSEDIYIKMNSRGKELTPFENFKARFEQLLGEEDSDFCSKIDNEWTELFWEYKENNDISKPFLRFFLFMSEMVYFEFFGTEDETTNKFLHLTPSSLEKNGEHMIEFYELVEQIYFNKNCNETSEQAQKILFNALDLLANKKKQGIITFFNKVFYTNTTYLQNIEKEKVNLFRDDSIDLLERIVNSSQNPQSFKLLFYFIIKSKFEENDLNLYQIVRNLVINDEDNMRAGDLSNQIKTLNNILKNRSIQKLDLKNSGFSNDHLLEEQFKENAIKQYPQYIPIFLKMENYKYFKGSIRAVFNTIIDSPTDKYENLDMLLEKDCTEQLQKVFRCVKELLGDDLSNIWGELLIDEIMYKHEGDRLNHKYRCVRYNSNYEVSSFLPMLIEYYNKEHSSLEEYLIIRCREFVKNNTPLTDIECPQKQIYTIFLIHTHILKKGYKEFFVNKNWQFGIYGKHDWDWYENDIDKLVSKSPFKYQTTIQLFNSIWGGAQPFLKQPTKEDLEKLEQF